MVTQNYEIMLQHIKDNFVDVFYKDKSHSLFKKEMQEAYRNCKESLETLKNFDRVQKQSFEAYNATYAKVQGYKQQIKDIVEQVEKDEAIAHKKDKKAVVDELINKKKQEGVWDSYTESQLGNYEQQLKDFENEVKSAAVAGYRSIMRMRELITGQTIIYAIQTESGSKINNYYLTEDEYLNALYGKRGRSIMSASKEAQRINQFDLGIRIGEITKHLKKEKDITEKDIASQLTEEPSTKISHTRDIYYALAADFADQQAKHKVLQKADIFELYLHIKGSRATGFRAIEMMRHFIFQKKFKMSRARVATRGQFAGKVVTNGRMNQGSAAFYQAGDTAAFLNGNDGSGGFVGIQAKRQSGKVSIVTIKNALNTIVKIFGGALSDQSDARTALENLFTMKFQNTVRDSDKSALRYANDAAQKALKGRYNVIMQINFNT